MVTGHFSRAIADPACNALLKPKLHGFDTREFGTCRQLVNDVRASKYRVALLITCSDLGFAPEQWINAPPNRLSIIQNLGNMVPHHSAVSKRSNSIDVAIRRYEFRHVVVSGHLRCRALKHLLCDELTSLGGATAEWLRGGLSTVQTIKDHYHDFNQTQFGHVIAAQEHVLSQLEILRTLSCVRERLAVSRLHLHGWYFDDVTGIIQCYDPQSGQFTTCQSS